LNKIVLFGAGKIGRSFIGQLFSRGGYEVVFIDRDKEIIDALNLKRSYRVIIKSELQNDSLVMENIRAIHFDDKERIAEEISGTSILATCIGPANLSSIIPVISEGIRIKFKNHLDCRTDLIIAENLRNAADYLRELFIDELADSKFVEKNIGLVETSIGKMVPIMTRKDIGEDPLQVFAEPYNTLIMDGKAFKNPIPQIQGLAPKENMKAWVDRKSFIHNLGHATAAYYGYVRHPELTFLHEVLGDEEVLNVTKATMLQSAEALMKEYPGEFTSGDLQAHTDDLIFRFRNKALGDTVYRVGMDLYRKLGPEDRLVGAIRMAAKHHMPYDRIAFAVACGLYFRAKDESGQMYPADREFAENFSNSTTRDIIYACCGIDRKKERKIIESILFATDQLTANFNVKS
jgi:mannitol-1-phosphate 5-dehydrogenase